MSDNKLMDALRCFRHPGREWRWGGVGWKWQAPFGKMASTTSQPPLSPSRLSAAEERRLTTWNACSGWLSRPGGYPINTFHAPFIKSKYSEVTYLVIYFTVHMQNWSPSHLIPFLSIRFRPSPDPPSLNRCPFLPPPLPPYLCQMREEHKEQHKSDVVTRMWRLLGCPRWSTSSFS